MLTLIFLDSKGVVIKTITRFSNKLKQGKIHLQINATKHFTCKQNKKNKREFADTNNSADISLLFF